MGLRMRDNSTVKSDLDQAFSSLLKMWEPYQNYRRQKGDMKHVPYRGSKILGGMVQNLVNLAIWYPAFVHP